MRFLLAAVISALPLIGCSPQPIALADTSPILMTEQIRFQDPGPNTAPVIIRRDAGGFCAMAVYVDNEPAAYIRAKEVATLHIPAGEALLFIQHTAMCGLGTGRISETAVLLSPGKPVHYRIGWGNGETFALTRTGAQ
jgi:hypothetical protein